MLNNSKYFVMNFFLLDEHEKYSANETSLVSQAISEISKSSKERLFNIVSCEDEADIIVLLESSIYRCHKDIGYYKSIIGRWSDQQKVFVINYEDHPCGAIPGLYSSLESKNFDTGMHKSWPHLISYNEHVDTVTNSDISPKLLFSFTGSCSHSLRRIIFNSFEKSIEDVKVTEIKKWYNHSAKEKKSYVIDMLNSHFVLCPRGLASYSHRILETLALGRVPVIIADEWVPFDISEKDYYIQIPECDVQQVQEILRSNLCRYDELRANSEKVYKKYFARGDRYVMALNKIVKLSGQLSPQIDGNYLMRRLLSRNFHQMNNWLLYQRLMRASMRLWDKFLQKTTI
jgi:hypothetical protein